jgi:predicted MFS family arabinose efflux permease
VAAPSVAPAERRWAIRFILCFGLVSLFADMTYEGAHGSIGPMLKDLGASVAAVAVISGLGEMIGASLRFFSGRLADRTHAYWTLAVAGYALNVLAVPGLAFVSTWQGAAILIVIERTGKALRGPARDLLLSEATGKVGHGWGFGLHAAMDQTGAMAGPLLMALIVARTGHFQSAFAWLAIPAVLALLSILAARAVRAVDATPPTPNPPKPLPRVFWTYIAAAGLLACGFIDFPVLGAHFEKQQLFSKAIIPLLYSLAMGVNGLTAVIFGRLYDRYGLVVLTFGIVLSMLALPLGFLSGATGAVAAVICWATGLGVQDATLRSGIAQVVSMNKRGTAFGIFNGVYGVMWFLGSAVMGLLYAHSIVALVAFGVAAQLVAAVMFAAVRRPLETAAA